MKTKVKCGFVAAGPSECLIHVRRGRIVRQGMGLSTFRLPVIDRCCVIPCTANSIQFAADQITKENQGVEIAGFAIWKIAKPEITYLRYDFDSGTDQIVIIGAYLKDVVESAIRHRLANMTMEDVLRKRATLILDLKKELAYITEQWGLEIDTIEIKNVKIMSRQVFGHMQAKYRDQLRLESETSAIGTEQEIAERKQSLALRQTQLAQEVDLAKLAEVHAVKTASEDMDLALYKRQQANRIESDNSRQMTLAAAKALQDGMQALEKDKKNHDTAMARMDAEAEQFGISADNSADPRLALIKVLPEVVRSLKINEININPDLLAGLIAAVSAGMGRPSMSETSTK